MARRFVRPLPRFRLRARAGTSWRDRTSRHHGRLRGAARRSASRCDAGAHRRDCRRSGRSGGDQSDHLGENGFYRPRRGFGGDGNSDRAAALERGMIDRTLRTKATQVLKVFRARGLKIATAESCTGGLVAGGLTEIAGSSDVVDRGFVTYSNAAKEAMLGVPAATLERYGAVSAETAAAMAAGALKNSLADVTVAITGIAGPGGGSKQKPVGLVHFSAASRDGRRIAKSRRYGKIGRRRVRERSVAEALDLLASLAQ